MGEGEEGGAGIEGARERGSEGAREGGRGTGRGREGEGGRPSPTRLAQARGPTDRGARRRQRSGPGTPPLPHTHHPLTSTPTHPPTHPRSLARSLALTRARKRLFRDTDAAVQLNETPNRACRDYHVHTPQHSGLGAHAHVHAHARPRPHTRKRTHTHLRAHARVRVHTARARARTHTHTHTPTTLTAGGLQSC